MAFDPTMQPDSANSGMLRVSVHEHDIQSMIAQFPKLTRTEVVDVIGRAGPMRAHVEAELRRLSDGKR